MTTHAELPKFSLGVGDRFAHQARPQLEACRLAAKSGVAVAPVWNKSNREHNIIGSKPQQTRAAADAAVRDLNWSEPYFVDADHIGLTTVDRFLQPCDFFTIDVADWIGKPADPMAVSDFVSRHPELAGEVHIAGVPAMLPSDRAFVERVANKFLAAITEAGRVYRHIADAKTPGTFVTEISMDETDSPQTPVELLIILAAVADEKIPIQTIAPKFTGRFNKGVDYVGDTAQFTREFSDDVAVLRHAVAQYGLPANLKLSVHSGSDKFSIYRPIRQVLSEFDAGVHLKTAGTNWLEELIGLAESDGAGLGLAKEIYAEAYDHRDELCVPYATVIDIDLAQLPSPATVRAWSPVDYTRALRHHQSDPAYNRSFRQLLHVGFKVAAKHGNAYLNMLDECRELVGRNVTDNLFLRHIKPLFLT
jgi:tagaturonate epimerase